MPLSSSRFTGLAVAGFVSLVIALADRAAAETVVEIPTRAGQTVRALLEKPAGTPLGSVVLIAGGHGNLALGKDGSIGWGKGNQMVRTRADYAKAGFVAIVPDIAPDLKDGEGGKSGYRWSRAHADDLGAVIKHARSFGGPVYLVGTSRGALSIAATGATQTKGPVRPDALVITAGMLMSFGDKQPSVETKVPGLANITQPVLLMSHAKDGCAYTPANSTNRFKPLLAKAQRVDVMILTGGSAGASDADPCQAQTHHGFLGQDGEVVARITGWLQALPKP